MQKAKPTTITEFIAACPKESQAKLKQIRTAIRKLAPKAAESISYGIATYKLNGRPLIYFSGYKTHIGIYPRSKAMDEELAEYVSGRGTYKFPLDEKLPMAKITKLVKARMREVRPSL